MKKSILWIIVFAALVIGGGGYVITRNNQASQPAPTQSSSKTSNKEKKSSSSSISSSSSQSSEESSASNNNSSEANSSSSSSSAQSSSSVDTGNAGKQGVGKPGDHTVNGKTVDQDTIINMRDKLKSLGFNEQAWSPQDIIDLYRFATSRGHSDPDQLTKQDVEAYLNK
ncbi:SpoIIIAH-like family protein [Lactobacillus kalixensis]|uniref:Uncharacterized protein n=1 Tax=Lactobacillus kalixensis DSM 16043 TaxID=1423763 RepID=A0A0R1U893_9LACO|nr:SpoIIIAH-like family protein [Lactobacillus kalixensis]KRL87237.1 hypothetical protein FC46_GL001812 [Lactobacillus kalixensis DSM 16043]